MNRLFLPLFTATALLFGTFTALGADVRKYDLILPDGTKIPTTIVWTNLQGLDTIRGDFHYAAGELGFSGKNSASGFIWMNDENGTYYEFRKEKTGSSFRWVGSSAVGERLILAPKGSSSAQAPSPPSSQDGTVRHYMYLPDGGGTPFPVSITWDNIKGLGNIRGVMTLPTGKILHFSGTNPESGFIQFQDTEGANYSLWKRKRGNSFEWAGTGANSSTPFAVTLVPSDKPGNAVVPAPAPAGETVRQYTMTGPWGQKYPATIVWSNIKGLGAISGTLSSPGQNLTISGQNSRSGFIYFNDQHGTYYELTKQNPVNGKVRWAGTALFNDGSSRNVELIGN